MDHLIERQLDAMQKSEQAFPVCFRQGCQEFVAGRPARNVYRHAMYLLMLYRPWCALAAPPDNRQNARRVTDGPTLCHHGTGMTTKRVQP